MEGQAPTMERLEHLLKDLLHEEARRAVTIDQIQRRVADHFDIRLADMTSKRRPANIAFPAAGRDVFRSGTDEGVPQ